MKMERHSTWLGGNSSARTTYCTIDVIFPGFRMNRALWPCGEFLSGVFFAVLQRAKPTRTTLRHHHQGIPRFVHPGNNGADSLMFTLGTCKSPIHHYHTNCQKFISLVDTLPIFESIPLVGFESEGPLAVTVQHMYLGILENEYILISGWSHDI